MTDEIGRREFIKRGALAGVVATAGLPGVAPLHDESLAEPAKTSAVASRTSDSARPDALAGRHLDSREFCLSEYDALRPALSFSATTPDAAHEWRERARRRLVERLGGFPGTRSPLNVEVLETRDFGAYTREKIVFDTRPNLSTIGYFLLPKSGARRLAAVVCVSGHGRGLPDILGLDDEGNPRTQRNVGYSKEYALQCVEHGYATLAVEQLAFGTRRDEAARRAGPAVESCRPAACAALLFGQTMAGWRVWDAMRAIDYLATRPEVDPARVATLGASGGGTTSLLTAAVDERVKVAVVSAYFNTFRDSIVSISHCPDNYVPGLLQDMELYDLSGLVAPRALFVESGRNDRIFPIAGSEKAAAKAREIYAASGVPDLFGYEIHEGGHEVHLVGAFDFLARRL
ncbi:MAG TPA: alpha/beta hydrolase family protein [Gemmatimonadaceae bacterium]|jgi:dienelactone hydrolase|nr:alpha/beta hydrolase family protein [Gemmatimonadaceae bacterium]